MTDKSSTFTIVAAALAVSLLAAAGVSYLQSGNSAASAGNAPALAAVSQAIPLHVSHALAGDPEGFNRLEADVNRLATLKSGSSSLGLPGGAGAWNNLERDAGAILSRRADIEAITNASRLVDERMGQMLTASDALLDQSGATAAVQEFQRRGAAMQTALAGLAGSAAAGNPGLVESITADMAYLRSVTEALSGGDSALDIAALDDATREVALVPVISELVDIEAQVAAATAAAAGLGDLGASVTGVNNVAATLLGGAFSSSGSEVAAFWPIRTSRWDCWCSHSCWSVVSSRYIPKHRCSNGLRGNRLNKTNAISRQFCACSMSWAVLPTVT